MSHDTELKITELNDQVVHFSVVTGRIGLALRQLDGDEQVEIELSQQGVRLLQPGRYDIDAETQRVAVFMGQARLAGSGGDSDIAAGGMALLAGSGSAPAKIDPAAPDEFVDWCQSRDSAETHLAAPYYVSPYMTGFAELDAAGSWESTADYGAIWVPNALPADWAPYRDGHWNWIAPWGWTWIDDQPWGFAPFHYGRWAFVGERWAWVPGNLCRAPSLCAGGSRLPRHPRRGAERRRRRCPGRRLVPARPGRGLLAELYPRSGLCSRAQSRQCPRPRGDPDAGRRRAAARGL